MSVWESGSGYVCKFMKKCDGSGLRRVAHYVSSSWKCATVKEVTFTIYDNIPLLRNVGSRSDSGSRISVPLDALRDTCSAYYGFFPEVARELTKRGAEVIAWPVWGCNPDLARARAAENHVYLVSSTYEDVSRNWMLSAIWDHGGRTPAFAKDWGTVAIAEVDLNARTRWPSLGDFKSKLSRHVPMIPSARQFEPVVPALAH